MGDEEKPTTGGQTETGRRPPRKRGSTRRAKCATSATALRRQALAKRIIELRLEGYTVRGIAEKLQKGGWKTSKSDVQTILAEQLKEVGASQETKAQARALSLERLEGWMRALAKRAKKGDDKAISVSKSLDERIAKYLGTEAPEEHRVKLSVLGQLNWVFDMVEKEFGPDGSKRLLRRISEESGAPEVGAPRERDPET